MRLRLDTLAARSVIAASLLFTTPPAHALCDRSDSWLDIACAHVADTWTEGGNDFYLPLHTYHLRSAYSEEEINSFREDNWGLGYGRSRYNESGNWEGLYAMVFQDSHSKPEPIVGYGYEWMWGDREALHAGIGFTALITARSEIGHYTPLPGLLPIASVNYRDLSLNTTFVPGGEGHGNVFLFWSRIGF